MLRSLKGLYHFIVACVANVWFGFPSRKLTVIGVTGTDGKTTTTTVIYEILKSAGIRASMITSVHAVIAGKAYDTGFHVTTPSAWWVQKYLREAADHGDTHMVLEVTSHALTQYRVTGIRFSAGVITNITHEHLDWHGTFERYRTAKLSLWNQSDIAIGNADDPEQHDAIMRLSAAGRIKTYGLTRSADFNPAIIPLSTALPGTFNRYNVFAAAAAAISLGVEPAVVRKAISEFSGVPGRMETVCVRPFRVIVDFAHTPNAIDKALATARKTAKKRLIHVFGSAGLRDASKRPAMGEASAKYSDLIVLTEEDYRTEDVNAIISDIEQGIPKGIRVMRIPDRMKALEYALSHARSGDTVIITGKGHERSLARGTVEHPWSDQDAVRRILTKT